MADVVELLQRLRPLREPPAPASIVPFLQMLAMGVLAAIATFSLRWAGRMGTGLQRSANASLAASRRLVPSERLTAQAQLLRRLVRHHLGDDAARAEGTAWLAILDSAFDTTFFKAGEGRVFGGAIYRRGSETDVDAIDQVLSGLIRKSPRMKKSTHDS